MDVNAEKGFGSAGPGFGAINSTTYTPMLGGPIPKETWTYAIDKKANTAAFKANDSGFTVPIPLHPFLGCVGVAPANGEARSSLTPAEFGGNMDAPEATAGNTLYLSVNVAGALLYLGDGHAAMGDGEAHGTAVEISMKVKLRVEVIKHKEIAWPRFENADYIMAVGIYVLWMTHCASPLPSWFYGSTATTGSSRYGTLTELLSKVAEIHLDQMVDPNYTVVAKIQQKVLFRLLKSTSK